jgi:hypothetical protein
MEEDTTPAEIYNSCSTQHEDFCPSFNLDDEAPINLDICNACTEDTTMDDWRKVDQTWQHPQCVMNTCEHTEMSEDNTKPEMLGTVTTTAKEFIGLRSLLLWKQSAQEVDEILDVQPLPRRADGGPDTDRC